jgi:DNA-binding winged helix-turn-helix (wHTH) protein/TolB-like protein
MAAPIAFSGFRFDPTTGELTGPNGSIRLGPQPAKVLAMLTERPGDLVTRAEIKSALWPDTVVEADQGLNFCIRQIRAALGDEAEYGRFIETLPKRGYRFVGALDTVTAGPVSAPAPVARSRGRGFGVAFGLTALIAIGAAVFIAPKRLANRNVAILPLTPQPNDPDWVADASRRITDGLVVHLTAEAPASIGVVGPATTAPLASDKRPHTELGRLLGVGYVMSGGIRMSDSTVFIQVIRASDGVHVYAMRRRAFGANIDSLTTALAAGAAGKILAR